MAAVDLSASAVPVAVDVPLAPLTTYKVGGRARWLAEPENEAELAEVVAIATEAGIPTIVLGRGSNVVVSDDGFEGLVLRLAPRMGGITIGGDGVVTAGAAAALPKVARTAVDEGRGGLEFLVGIPGSVGGAVRMNAGCLGSETADAMVDGRILDMTSGEVSLRRPPDLDMSYRHSNLTDEHIVLSARFRTVPVDVAVGKERLRQITRWRRDNQPGGTLNAGSVFKNPEGDAAGRIIDGLGLKGLSAGAVSVSMRHANFFEAGVGADAQSVYDLVGEVRRRVRLETGIDLEPEVRFIGRFHDRHAGGAVP